MILRWPLKLTDVYENHKRGSRYKLTLMNDRAKNFLATNHQLVWQ